MNLADTLDLLIKIEENLKDHRPKAVFHTREGKITITVVVDIGERCYSFDVNIGTLEDPPDTSTAALANVLGMVLQRRIEEMLSEQGDTKIPGSNPPPTGKKRPAPPPNPPKPENTHD